MTLGQAQDNYPSEEWFEIRGWFEGEPVGWIPRSVAESLGVDCRPADREPRGTIWFSREQVEAIHDHPRYQSGIVLGEQVER